MKWRKKEDNWRVPILSWCEDIDEGALEQAYNLAAHPIVFHHVALMPDCHKGFGMPIGGVIACENAIVPNAVGVDISCGMIAAKTNISINEIDSRAIGGILNSLRRRIPVGFHHHRKDQDWDGFDDAPDIPIIQQELASARKQLGTLGGGNHFIEIQAGDDGHVWLMLHSGSRNIGYKIAKTYNKIAIKLCNMWHSQLPPGNGEDSLAFLPIGSREAKEYIEAMKFAMRFAEASRLLMMKGFLRSFKDETSGELEQTININHNFANLENHFGRNVWVHRKGATQAKKGQLGIIPGCLAQGTRILLANGFYKNIEEIAIGDRIIAKDGSATTVTGTFARGIRRVKGYKNNNFHSEIFATSDHLHFIGDLSTVKNSYPSAGYVKSLEKLTINGGSKYRWCRLGNFPQHFTFLLPKDIKFEIPDSFSVSRYGIKMGNGYASGYVIGTFLGDGTAYYSRHKGGQISWAFGKEESDIASRLSMRLEELGFVAKRYIVENTIQVVVHDAMLGMLLNEWGKRDKKKLDEDFWCSDPAYLRGLYDGLIDSDGHSNNGTAKLTNTSKEIIEIFGVIHYLLFGYFPSVSVREPSCGGLNNCNIDNCKPSFRSTSLRYVALTKDYQVIKHLGVGAGVRNVETFDLEVAHEEHGFVANNLIVHNSMGTPSYIVRGLGNSDSFESCSHGAGRASGRAEFCRTHTVEECEKDMEGIVFGGWGKTRKGIPDISEAPKAYKDVEKVIAAQDDLVEVVVKLRPLGVMKG